MFSVYIILGLIAVIAVSAWGFMKWKNRHLTEEQKTERLQSRLAFRKARWERFRGIFRRRRNAENNNSDTTKPS